MIKTGVEIISADKTENRKLNRSGQSLRRVAAYCRVSTNSQEQLDSYQSQKKYYSELIEKNENWVLAGIYADEAITGTKVDKRPDFKRMIDDAVSGQIDMILCKSISRFARNTVDTLQYVRLLKEHDVGVYFEEENIKTLSMDGELLLTILSSVAQQEVENISEHVKTGLRHKMSSGQIVGFSGCLGYDYDPEEKKITVNEEEAAIVRYIYRRYLEGAGCKMIANECAERKWRTKRGNTKWHESAIAAILKNEKYKGDLLSGKTITVDPIGKRRLKNKGEEDKYLVRHNHEPIVSETEWYKVQDIFKKRKKIDNQDGAVTNARYSKQYTFSSKLECGYCGKLLTRRTTNNYSPKTKKTVWQCVNYAKFGKKYCSECKAIKEELIEDAFVEVFNRLMEQQTIEMDSFLKDAESVLSKQEYDKNLKKLSQKVKDIQKKKNLLIDLYIEKGINKEDYNERYKLYDEKLKELQSGIKKTSESKAVYEEQRKRLKDFKESITADNRMKEFDPVIFDKLVEKVIVGGVDEAGNSDPYQLIFVLKIGISNTGNNAGGGIGKIGLNAKKHHLTTNNIIEDDLHVRNDTRGKHLPFEKAEPVTVPGEAIPPL